MRNDIEKCKEKLSDIQLQCNKEKENYEQREKDIKQLQNDLK